MSFFTSKKVVLKDSKENQTIQLSQEGSNESMGDILRGEKLDEVLINKDEMKYAWEFEDMYVVVNPSVQTDISSLDNFPNKKKIENIDVYSSDFVEKISVEELKKIFTNTGLLN